MELFLEPAECFWPETKLKIKIKIRNKFRQTLSRYWTNIQPSVNLKQSGADVFPIAGVGGGVNPSPEREEGLKAGEVR